MERRVELRAMRSFADRPLAALGIIASVISAAEMRQRTGEVIERVLPPVPVPMAAGRNQLCPCGSGKKYKRCCRGDDAKGRIPKPVLERTS